MRASSGAPLSTIYNASFELSLGRAKRNDRERKLSPCPTTSSLCSINRQIFGIRTQTHFATSPFTSFPFDSVPGVQGLGLSMSVTSSDSLPRQLPRKPSSLRPADLSSLSLDQSLSEVPAVFIRDVLKDLGTLGFTWEIVRS